MMEIFASKYPDRGYLIVVDEFLDYLGGRNTHEVKMDLGFMREIGEFIKKSKMRAIFGVQEKLFDNPNFSFVSDTLNRVKDRFEQVIIRKEDTAYVVSERILKKDAEQRAKIREHLLQFCSLYTNMSERIEEYVNLFPIHPSYIDVFNKIYIIENRHILKNISEIIRRVLNDEITSEAPGIISFDSYWSFIKENMGYRTDVNIKEVVEKSGMLEDIVNRSFPKRLYKSLAIQIINALSVHRLTTGDISIRAGLTAENLRDDLCLYLNGMPDQSSDTLQSVVQTVLKDVMTTVSGQFIESNHDNGQYYLDLKKDIDYDEKITQRAAVIDDDSLNNYFYDVVYYCLDWDQKEHVTNFKIYEGNFQMNEFNSFFSVNTFIRPRRILDNLFELTCCFIDLDIYTLNLSKEMVLYYLEEDVFGFTIPTPTYIIDSGNGFYLIWQFTENVLARKKGKLNTAVHNLWTKTQKALYTALKEFGSDKNALDATRVLRNTNTFNTKNDKLVPVVFARHYGNKYDLRTLVNELLPPLENKTMAYKQKKKKEHKEYLDTTILIKKQIQSSKNLKMTNSNRLDDLNKLVKIRNGDFPRMREQLLFIYRCHANLLYSPSISLEMTLTLNSRLKSPLKISEVIQDTKSAEKNNYLANHEMKSKEYKWQGYQFRTELIIERLNITESEQCLLKTLCNKNIKKTRKNEKLKNSRRNSEGYTSREIQKKSLVEDVQKLYQNGMKSIEIARKLDITKSTVSKYIKLAQDNTAFPILLNTLYQEI